MRFTLRLTLTFALLLTLLSQLPGQPGKKKKDPEPSGTEMIGGKTLDQWIAEIKVKDPSVRENAIRTIMLYGPVLAARALPTLIPELRANNDVSIKVNAAIAVGYIVSGNQDLKEKQVTASISGLTRFLQDSQSIVRYHAAKALGAIGPEAKSAIPQLLITAKDYSTWEVRQAAAFALGTIGTPDKKNPPDVRVVRALLLSLDDVSGQVRLSGVQALIRIGPPADATLKLTMDRKLATMASKDRELTVQIWSHVAIMRMSKIDTKRLGTIAGYLKKKDLQARCHAAQALGAIGPDAASQVGRLVEAFNDPDPMVGGWAMWGLAQMGKYAAPALPALRSVQAQSKNEMLKQAAAEAIEAIEEKPKKKQPKGMP